jgi:hypothetical protein
VLDHLGVDAPMPVPAMILVENFRDRGLDRLLGVGSLETGLVIKESRPGQAGDLKQNRQRKVSLEGDDGLDLHRRSCALKARNFPR